MFELKNVGKSFKYIYDCLVFVVLVLYSLYTTYIGYI